MNQEYKIDVYLSHTQEVPIDSMPDRVHEGVKTISVQHPINERGLTMELAVRLASPEAERISYTVAMRRLGEAPSSMTDLGIVYYAQAFRVSQSMYAEDIMQIIKEFIGKTQPS